MLHKVKDHHLFLVLIALLFFKPSPGYLLGEGIVSLITLAVAFIGLAIFLWIFAKQYQSNNNLLMHIRQNIDIVVFYNFLFVFSLLISVLAGLMKESSSASIFDLTEIYRFIYYLTFYLVARNIVITDKIKIEKPIIIMVIIVELIGILQYFNVADINNHIGLLYILSERHYDMIIKVHRIPSTFLNPNLYGSFLIIVVALLLSYMTYIKKGIFVMYLLLFTTFISLYFTTSRTSVIAIAFLIVYWIFLNIFIKKSSIKKFFLHSSVLVLFVLVGYVLIPQIHYLNYAKDQIISNHEEVVEYEGESGFSEDLLHNSNAPLFVRKTLNALYSVDSFQKRFEFWYINYEKFKENPILGGGLMKGDFINFADNQYLYILARYGIVGLIIYTSFFLLILFKSFVIMKRSDDQFKKKLAMAINLTICAYFVAGLTSEAWFNLQSITFLFVLLGLVNRRMLPANT